MSFSKWVMPSFDKDKSREIQAEYGVSAMVADILVARNFSKQELDEILDDKNVIADPFLLDDMDKAVARINKAIELNEKIAVYGDYDCDGVTATVIVVSFLQSMGADVFYYIPERQEGYGLNNAAIDMIDEKGAKLLITVDNGISAFDEIDYANSKGIDVIVTDHHQVGEKIPSALAVINPHRKEYNGFKELCGAGVALKLCAAIDGDYENIFDSFSVLAAIGTIGDVVKLKSENRLIVKKGLEQILYTDNIGITALIKASGLENKTLNAQRVAFSIVPRINAAGRMGKANLATELLFCEDEETAFDLAQMIEDLNAQRRVEEEKILKILQGKIEENPQVLLDRVLLVESENLHHGVLGIVASRLSNLYGKPAFVLSAEDELSMGSARSIGDFSIYSALTYCDDILIKYGGHKSAAGVTLKTSDVNEFREKLNEYASENYDLMPVVTKNIDKELHIDDINVNSVSELEILEPCGEDNFPPVFLLRNCTVEAIQPLAGDKHLKIKVNFEGKNINLLYFKMSSDKFIYSVGNKIDVLANLEINTFHDVISIAVKISDIRPCNFEDVKMINAEHFYGKIRRNEKVDKKIIDISVPNTDELRTTYKILKKLDDRDFCLDDIYLLAFSGKINYCKFKLMIDILEELSLIFVSRDFSSVKILKTEKVDLESSKILSDLKRRCLCE